MGGDSLRDRKVMPDARCNPNEFAAAERPVMTIDIKMQLPGDHVKRFSGTAVITVVRTGSTRGCLIIQQRPGAIRGLGRHQKTNLYPRWSSRMGASAGEENRWAMERAGVDMVIRSFLPGMLSSGQWLYVAGCPFPSSRL